MITGKYGLVEFEEEDFADLPAYSKETNKAIANALDNNKGDKGDKGDKGENGNDGIGIYYSSYSASTSTTSISISTISIPEGRKLQIGDFIIANSTYSYLYRVTSVGSSTVTVSYLQSLRGASGSSESSVSVVDSLTSTSTTSALSANQGKVLNEKIAANKTTIVNNVASTSTTSALSANMGKALNDKIDENVITGTYTSSTVLKPNEVTRFDISLSKTLATVNYQVYANIRSSGSYTDWIAVTRCMILSTTKIQVAGINLGSGATTGTTTIEYMLVKK